MQDKSLQKREEVECVHERETQNGLLMCEEVGLKTDRLVRTILRALANDSMATASFPGVLLARSVTTLAISISEQPDGDVSHT